MKYLVCVDGSEGAHKAVDKLSKMVLKSDEIVLFSAFSVEKFYQEGIDVDIEIVPIAKDKTIYEKEVNAARQRCQVFFTKAQEKLKQSNASISTAAVDVLDVRDGILQFAKENHVDVIVVGTRGLGQIKKLLLGSVSDYVVDHAECSVLVVR